ncbi:MAG: hypothetical protein V1820_01620 [archaeon]
MAVTLGTPQRLGGQQQNWPSPGGQRRGYYGAASPSYWPSPQRGYSIPSSGGSFQIGKDVGGGQKKILYILAILLLLGGAFLVYTGFTASPPKISIKLEGLADKDTAIIGIVCSPCGSAQESSVQLVVGKDNYKGTTKTQFGQELMIAQANGAQVFQLSEKDWVKYIDRIE